MVKFYNSLTRDKQDFKPIKKGEVKMYSCGPTVYNYVHIGNLRSYILMDLLVKTLKYFGYNVINVMNITDVDDKTIRDSNSIESANPNETLKKFTRKFEEAFLEDLAKINVDLPKYLPRATETIPEMNLIIQRLMDKGYAYITEDGIYYDISKNKNYGKLVKLDLDKLKYNKKNRVISDEYDKDDVKDFALWKFRKGNEPYWEIEIDGKKYVGRPGWHIECSAMSYKYLGEHFDIHTGGVDLKFPHHENEIAQSECANNGKFVNYWLHNEHLIVNNKKMSKSLNNFYTLRDLEEKGYSPLSLRYLLLSVHYRQLLNFTFESLEAARNTVKKINDFYQFIINFISKNEEIETIREEYEIYKKNFKNALGDDLNTPVALSLFFEFQNFINRNLELLTKKDVKIVLEALEDFNKIFSVIIPYEIPLEVIDLAEERKKMKEEKNFERADELRKEINKLGYEIKDYKNVKNGYLILKKVY